MYRAIRNALTYRFSVTSMCFMLLPGLFLACAPQEDVNALVENSADESTATDHLYPVSIKMTSGIGTLESGIRSPLGQPVGIACDVCHSPNPENAVVTQQADALESRTPFHNQVRMVKTKHGDLTCAQCHNRGRLSQSTLHLADQSPVEYPAVVYLCGQCHGPQFRDYKNGTHGGAAGYWDLTKGAMERNHCVNCHDPHAPAYPSVTPVAPPRSRNVPISESGEMPGDAGGNRG